MALSWFHGNRGVVVGLGCGVLIGISGTLIAQHMTDTSDIHLAQLCLQIDSLRAQIDQLSIRLPSPVQAVRSQRRVRMGYYSVHPSSGEDDDDDFQEAVSNFENATAEKLQGLVDKDFAATTGQNSPGALFDQVDYMLDASDKEKEEAFRLLKKVRPQLEMDADFMWRLAKATYFMSQIEGMHGNEENKKKLVYESLDVANKALEYNKTNPYIHKWVAITLGSVGDYESTKVRITNGFKFKEHIVTAIQLKPTDPSNHYLLGRWCYGVYMLGWVERQLAATLFAEPPTATVDQALEEFLEAERLDPSGWKENMLYIGKCYIEKSEYPKAADWLIKANRLPTVSADEKEAQLEIDTLLYKYGSYKLS